MYLCSNPVELTAGNQYKFRISEPGEHRLMINAVTKNMTGVFVCKDDAGNIHDSILLNVICKYISVLFCVMPCHCVIFVVECNVLYIS